MKILAINFKPNFNIFRPQTKSYSNPLKNCEGDIFVKSSALSFKGGDKKTFEEKLDETFKTSKSSDDLILFIYDELPKRAKELNLGKIAEDTIQTAIVDIAEFLITESDKEKQKQFILDKYINLKPTKEDKPLYIDSLDSKIGGKKGDDKREELDFITEDNLPQPLTPATDEQRNASKEKLGNVLDSVNLTEDEKKILAQRFKNDDKETSYRKLAKENLSSYPTVRNKILIALKKIQYTNNALDKNFIQFAKDFKETFNLEMSEDEMIKFLIANPELTSNTLKKNEENVKANVKQFDVSEADFIKAALKQPSLFGQDPETLKKHIDENVKLFDISEKEILKIFMTNPILFSSSPEVMFKNAQAIKYLYSFKKVQAEFKPTRQSTNKTYNILLRNLIVKKYDIPPRMLPADSSQKAPNLTKYIKDELTRNPNKTFEFTIPKYGENEYEENIQKEFIEHSTKLISNIAHELGINRENVVGFNAE